MKTKFIFAALCMGAMLVACAPKEAETTEGQEPQENQTEAAIDLDKAPTKAEINEVSYLLGVNFGSFIKGVGLGEKFNYNEMIKGIKDFLAAKGGMYDLGFTEQFKYDPMRMQEVLEGYSKKLKNVEAKENAEKSAAFLEKNAKAEGVQQTESGLQYIIIEPGNDVKPALVDTVWVKYKGTLIDGTVFDEVAEDQEAVSFPLNQVIPGWGEGMGLIGEGGKIKLFVPSELAYGEMGAQGAIGPNSAIIFEVTLEKVGKAATE